MQHIGDTRLEQPGHVLVGDDATDDNRDVRTLFSEQRHDLGGERHVRPRQHRQSDDIDVFVDCGRHHHGRRLPQTGVNDFHSRITQDPRDDLDPTIVTIQTDLRHQYP